MSWRSWKKECYEGREISSSYVKESARKGKYGAGEYAPWLPYTVQGEVLHGRRIGARSGCRPQTSSPPSASCCRRTASTPPKPLSSRRHTGGRRPADGECCGISNIGYKPTVGEYFRGVETYLFDYEGDLYGRMIEVQLYAYERPEQKFPDMEELKAQMHRDIAFGKNYFRMPLEKTIFVVDGNSRVCYNS